MDTLAVVRKVTQDVLLFVCHKQKLIAAKPSPELSFVPEITPEFLENLSLTVWIDSYCNELLWEKVFCTHFSRMTASPHRFVNYVSYACYQNIQRGGNAYESFSDTLSLIIPFVLHCWHKGRREFLNTCVDLFCDLFEKEILSKFLDQGGWKNFNNYLLEHHEPLRVCKDLIETKQPLDYWFQTLEDQYRKSQKTYVMGNVLLKDITESQVLDDKEAVSFADSVASKMQKLVCKQTIEEIVADFKKTDKRVEELYRQLAGEATGGTDMEDLYATTKKVERSSTRKDKDANIETSEGKQSTSEKDKVCSEKTTKVQQSPPQKVPEVSPKPPTQTSDKKKKVIFQTPESDSVKSQNVEPEIEDLDLSLSLTKVEQAKTLLKNMLSDFTTVYELIKFLCSEKPI